MIRHVGIDWGRSHDRGVRTKLVVGLSYDMPLTQNRILKTRRTYVRYVWTCHESLSYVLALFYNQTITNNSTCIASLAHKPWKRWENKGHRFGLAETNCLYQYLLTDTFNLAISIFQVFRHPGFGQQCVKTPFETNKWLDVAWGAPRKFLDPSLFIRMFKLQRLVVSVA